jgi:hypothetical protein
MTFTVRDLMLNVFPDDEGDIAEHRLYGAGQAKPKPKPKPKPDCTEVTVLTGGPPGLEARAELASLAALREHLQQALHP